MTATEVPAVAITEPSKPRTVIGLERNGLRAAGLVLLVILVYAVGLPVVDALIPQPDTSVKAGSVVTLGGLARFTPAVGWSVAPDSQPDRGLYAVQKGGVGFAIVAKQSAETPDQAIQELEQQLQSHVDGVVFGQPQTVSTNDSSTGIAAQFQTPQQAGVAVAIVANGIVVGVIIVGPQGAIAPVATEVGAMLDSIQVRQ